MKRCALSLLLVLAIASCASDAPIETREETVKLMPVANRVIVHGERTPSLRDYMDTFDGSNYEYSKFYQDPFSGKPAIVDCKTVEKITFIFLIEGSGYFNDRSGKGRNDVYVKETWTHDNLDLHGGGASGYINQAPSRFNRDGYSNLLFFATLSIRKDVLRRPGTYTVAIDYKGQLLHESSFEFKNC